MSFADLPLPSTLLRALEARGLTDPTPVQEAIVTTDPTRDLLVSSRTGSGKTLAFGLAVLPTLLNEEGRAARRPGKPQVLVIAPTRELAQQVARELTWLTQSTGLLVTTCVGGVEPRREVRELQQGVHVVVGTPGRLCDHLSRGALALEDIAAVVLDEADEMLDMGFREELETMLQATPETRRTLLFSATLPPEAVSLAKRYTKDPATVAITSASASHEDIEHVVHLVDPYDRERAVVNVLRAHEAASALVFCQTRDASARLASGLMERGFSAVAFSGDLSQPERQRALQSVRDGRTRVLVCTDVAARGLDLPAVGLVIHADPATDTAALMHRSGRTGRAGKKGTAVALVPFHRARMIERVYRMAKIALRPTPLPTPEDIAVLDDARMRDRLRVTLEELDPADLAAAADIVAEATPKQLAALWIREQKRELPTAELLGQGRRRDRDDRPAREPREPRENRGDRPMRPNFDAERDDDGPRGDAVWFEINVGREQRADPKWLVPMLCRRGEIEKRDLGRIIIGPTSTRFEINPGAAERFDIAASRPDEKDPRVKVRPVVGRDLDGPAADSDDAPAGESFGARGNPSPPRATVGPTHSGPGDEAPKERVRPERPERPARANPTGKAGWAKPKAGKHPAPKGPGPSPFKGAKPAKPAKAAARGGDSPPRRRP